MNQYNRLMLFPTEPDNRGGYGIAVASDLAHLNPNQNDLVMFRSKSDSNYSYEVINILTNKTVDKIKNVLRLRSPFEVSHTLLTKSLGRMTGDFAEIFSGEVIFYRALRFLYPDKHIWVRFHNFYSLAKYRQSLRRTPINWKLFINLKLFSRLEREILSDRNVTVIFITQEDLSFAHAGYPSLKAEYWPVVDLVTLGLDQLDIKPPTKPRILFFGSASPAHTAVGVEYFSKKIFPLIKAKIPECEFHLFGSGTERYSAVRRGVFGHGRHEGSGLPFNGDGLFCVPDTHGCGIKLKIADLLRAHAPFISTPYGMSGYSVPPNTNILIEDIEDWPSRIIHYFQGIQPIRE